VSLKGDQIRRLCPVLNTIPENGSLITTHISSNNIMNHGSNMIITTEVNSSSSPQHYRAGTTLDQSRQYHRPPNTISRGYNELVAIPIHLDQSTHPSGAKAYDSARQQGNQVAIRPGIHLHRIRRHGKRGTTSYKWAVSADTEQLRLSGPSSSSSQLEQGYEEFWIRRVYGRLGRG
jgi:hypothetical protein